MNAPTTQDDILHGAAYKGADGVLRQVSDLPKRAPPVTATALARALRDAPQDYVVREGLNGEPRWHPCGHEDAAPLTTDGLIALLRRQGHFD